MPYRLYHWVLLSHEPLRFYVYSVLSFAVTTKISSGIQVPIQVSIISISVMPFRYCWLTCRCKYRIQNIHYVTMKLQRNRSKGATFRPDFEYLKLGTNASYYTKLPLKTNNISFTIINTFMLVMVAYANEQLLHARTCSAKWASKWGVALCKDRQSWKC